MTISRNRLLEIAAAQRAKREAESVKKQEELAGVKFVAKEPETPVAESAQTYTTQQTVVWNEEQLQAIELAKSGKPFCLIGAAGTGKTTTVKEIVAQLLKKFSEGGEKTGPNVVKLVSFTNRAVRNIAKAVKSIDAVNHCATIHSFLEYKPEYFEIQDEQTGEFRKTMQFVPSRHANNPISECKLVVVDESSMVSTDLFAKLKDAVPNATFIFIGDLNQLPPVFGDAILGYKLAELPVVELTKVYRQAMDSPIIAFQHKFTLAGFLPSDTHLKQITQESNGALVFQPLKQFVEDGDLMSKVFADYLIREMKEGRYDPESGQHVALIPYNKQFGTIEINLQLAQHLGTKRNAVVWHVIAGMENKYLAVGDYVSWNKREWYIQEISKNGKYFGDKTPKEASTFLNRYGFYTDGKDHSGASILEALSQDLTADAEILLRMTDGNNKEAETIKREASHIIKLRNSENPTEFAEISTSAEVNSLDFAYCTTIHKSQGSEWTKVYMAMTAHHKPMLSRELLYTGMTRAREKLIVIYSPQTVPGKKDNSIAKAVKRQIVPGKTWREKVEVFKGKAEK